MLPTNKNISVCVVCVYVCVCEFVQACEVYIRKPLSHSHESSHGRCMLNSSASSCTRLKHSWKKLASGVLGGGMIFFFFFGQITEICQQKDCLEGDREGGAWDLFIRLPSVIFGLPLSWDPKKNLHMIFTSQIFRASLALIFIYLFVCKKEFKSNREAQKQNLWTRGPN